MLSIKRCSVWLKTRKNTVQHNFDFNMINFQASPLGQYPHRMKRKGSQKFKISTPITVKIWLLSISTQFLTQLFEFNFFIPPWRFEWNLMHISIMKNVPFWQHSMISNPIFSPSRSPSVQITRAWHLRISLSNVLWKEWWNTKIIHHHQVHVNSS